MCGRGVIDLIFCVCGGGGGEWGFLNTNTFFGIFYLCDKPLKLLNKVCWALGRKSLLKYMLFNLQNWHNGMVDLFGLGS